MSITKKIAKIVFIITLFFLFTPTIKEKIIEEKIDYVINSKKIEPIYEGHLYIAKFNYKNIIK